MTRRRHARQPTRSAAPPRRRGISRLTLSLSIAAVTGAFAISLFSTTPRSRAVADAPVEAQAAAIPVHGYEVVRQYPHDASAFTQGLIVRDGFLYESTGLEGRSSLRKVEIETGRVVQKRDVEPTYFAEGLTDWKGQLMQLTYTTGVGFVYDLATFEPQGTFQYSGQGWGLTHDDRRLIMSDGTSSLRFLDPVTRKELGRLPVSDRGAPVNDLNELEYVQGQIYANVWHTDRIAVIRPETGAVSAWIDLTGLKPASAEQEAVLNGIAYDAARNRLFVTGKWWPTLFEIRVRPGASR
jgi:glutamine cyclotransferase